MIGSIIITPPYPKPLRSIYKEMPVLFVSGTKIDTSENGINIQLAIQVPFEDTRIISIIEKKRRQLSPDSMNMVALDTTHIPISPNTSKHYRWIRRLMDALETQLSRRIGAVLLFSRRGYKGKLTIQSSLFVHPNPYKRLPSKFLKKCDLNSYEFPNSNH